jgi:hypothetical protein
MPELLRFGRAAQTVFDLLGSQENDQTFSLGFVLSRSPRFLAAVVERLALMLHVRSIRRSAPFRQLSSNKEGQILSHDSG